MQSTISIHQQNPLSFGSLKTHFCNKVENSIEKHIDRAGTRCKE